MKKDLDIQTLFKENILDGIEHYPEKLRVSKVILYFERRGIFFTKTMIQSYVKIGLLPPLNKQKFYSRNHLVFLALTDALKNTYSLDNLINIFTPIFDLDFDILIALLRAFTKNYNDILKDEHKKLLNRLNQPTEFNANQEHSISYLLTMAKSSAIKDLTCS